MPYLGRSAHKVSGDTGKRYRQIIEAQGILIAYGKAAEYVAHILAVDVAGRKTAEKIVLYQVRSPCGSISPYAESLMTLGVGKTHLICLALHIVLPAVEERE